MNHPRWISLAFVAATFTAAALPGCGGSVASQGYAGYSTGYASSGSASVQSESAPAPASGSYASGTTAGTLAPPPAQPAGAPSVTASAPAPLLPGYAGGGAAASGDVPVYEPHPSERSGLATEWGESRYDPLSYQPFVRAAAQPFATAAVHYNDATGAMTQAAYRGATTPPVPYLGAYGGGVHIALRDENGAPLPGQIVNNALYVIGAAGQRYTITLTNETAARFEAVVSVDGLDVIDGHPGDFSHRGYILNPHDTVNIEGFRQNEQSVAAFRFGSVADSYAAQTGSARNVGVIGVALFNEAGVVLAPPPDANEVYLRESANPFPGGFAQPPARRYYW
jgi:hypothetical protein